MTDAVAGFLVRGRVQGVGFRWWVQQHARRLGLRGSVCNRPDGTVAAYAAGSAHELEAFRKLLERGPAGADVTEVASLPVPDGALADPFAITPYPD